MLGSRNRGVTRLGVMGLALVLLTAGFTLSASAAFHLWNVKEIFTNASGSVQFIEMFDNNAGEVFTNGFTLTANSDGVIKTFTFPSNLTGNTPGHLLIAVNGFSSLPGAVTPDFTFSQGGVSGNFFNPTATNITITFSGSGDQMAVTGAALPRDGVHSLTDANANGFPNPVTNASAGVNSPTNLAMNSGSVNVGAPTVMSAVSQKVHGASGTFGIPLPGVECRAAGANSSHRVVVTFGSPVTVSGVTVTSSNGLATASQSVSGTVVTVDLSAVANAQTLGITLQNVTSGSNSGDVPISMGVLAGDTTGNGTVSTSDIGETKSHSGEPVSATNFRNDVTASGGMINASDIGLVKASSGTQLPP